MVQRRGIPWRRRVPFVTPAVLLVAQFLWVATAPPAAAQIAGPNVNITRLAANQTEAAVAVNPTNPNQLFMASNHDGAAFPAGLAAFRSIDAGVTWTGGVIAAGGADGLPIACCDPTLSWDSFGNLFLVYLGSPNSVQVALSTNGGASFTSLGALAVGGNDQPTVTTGPGSVWVTYRDGGGTISARGAAVTGLGVVGAFAAAQAAPGSAGGNFGDIAVGPAGQVVVTYQIPAGGQGPATVFVNLDANGLAAGGFAAAVAATTTNVGGFDFIPPQPERSVDAEAGLAFDRSGGPANGRLYLIYTEEAGANESNDTDIMLRVSLNNGATWLAPTRLNDDAAANSQFNPRIALDQTTGNIFASWHDARLDLGAGGPGDVTAGANNDTRFFGRAGIVQGDGSVSLTPNIQISAGTSNENGGEPPGPGFADIDYGDYTGLAFHAGAAYPVWADNSNSTGDNPAGALNDFDIYTARVSVTAAPLPSSCASVPPPPPGAIVGTAGNDIITGTAGNDVIYGLDGQDQINGLGGDDVIYGGAGNDSLDGGGGNDLVCGQDGHDSVTGGSGNDGLSGGPGNDRLLGGDGNDLLAGDAGFDNLDGGTGTNANDGGTESDFCQNGTNTNCFP